MSDSLETSVEVWKESSISRTNLPECLLLMRLQIDAWKNIRIYIRTFTKYDKPRSFGGPVKLTFSWNEINILSIC